MPQSYQTGEFSSFVGGLVTEASPLSFPENGSLDELNMVINNDGTRRRRLGMDTEPGVGSFASGSGVSDDAISFYQWDNPGNDPDKNYLVVQLGAKITLIDRSREDRIGSGYNIGSVNLLGSGTVGRASYANIDGKLVVASNRPELTILTLDSFGSISLTSSRIKIRDLFGVAATMDGKDLWKSSNISYRPSPTEGSTSRGHIYNLRNQGWMEPRTRWFEQDGAAQIAPTGFADEETIGDPIKDFIRPRGARPANAYLPSNADSVTRYLYPRTDADIDNAFKDIERFDATSATSSRSGNYQVPKGHFIIDLFDRGSSRQDAYTDAIVNLRKCYGNNQTFTLDFYNDFSSGLPTDSTSGGIKHVADYAGRAWFAGIDGSVLSGDELSPDLSSYVFYSQQVKETENITNCYQDGDPTSKEAPDRLDTDGGFVRIAECRGIQGMFNLGSSLLVVAQNGVWAISGSDQGQFNANNQSVTKITEYGTQSPQSVVVVEGTLMYWSDEAIYQIKRNEVGEWTIVEASANIRKFYQDIPSDSLQYVRGVYDSYDRKVRWVYNNLIYGELQGKELVFDIKFGAFTPITFSQLSSNTPVVLSPILIPPYTTVDETVNVLSGSDEVLSDTDDVVSEAKSFADETREVAYITHVPNTGQVGFSTYNNQSFLDWETVDGTGVDAPAYLLTGYINGGDNTKQKQVPYIYFHFLRTETGFTDTGTDLEPVGESSCLVQSQWSWTNSVSAGKWGRQFQAYRYKRPYMPSGVSDSYDTGDLTIVTKSKLRGRGRALSIKLETEAGKDLQLLGWGMSIGANNTL